MSKKIYPNRILVVDFGALSTYCDSRKRHFLKILSIYEKFATGFDKIRGESPQKEKEGLEELIWKKITIFWHLNLKLNHQKRNMRKTCATVERTLAVECWQTVSVATSKGDVIIQIVSFLVAKANVKNGI